MARTWLIVACLAAVGTATLLAIAASMFLRYHPLGLFYASSRRDVPVLVYHGVSHDSASEYEISLEAFSAQMTRLKAEGYHTPSLQEYAAHLDGEAVLPERAVFITFHDQSEGWYELAYPLLRELGFKATFFLIVDRTPEERQSHRTSWAELREMVSVHDAKGWPMFEVAGHSFGHEPLARRDGEEETIYTRRLRHELVGNADAIETQLSVRPIAFALPYGEGFDDPFERERIRAVAEEAGYRMVQAGRYYDADGFWIGGMSIHGTASSMLEFEFALRYASHEQCLRDFGLWLTVVIERVFWRVLH